jgi:hypothetical protein
MSRACLCCGRSEWLAGSVDILPSELPKWGIARDGGHEFPDSGLARSEPQIIEAMGKRWPFWPGHWCGLLLILACAVMTGCAGVSSGGQQSNTNQNPPPGTGQLSVSPATLNFGTVAVDGSAQLTGTLTASTADVSVSSAAWNGQGYNVTGITFPVTVAAGKSVTYTVTFAPQAAGSSAGAISFVNDGSTSPVGQTLDGNGGQAGVHTVALTWDPSLSAVIGYNIYRGTRSGGPYQRLTSSPQPGTSYDDGSVLTGTTYYYVSTAVDASLGESAYSNQAQAVVP